MKKGRKPFVCNEMGERFSEQIFVIGVRQGNVPSIPRAGKALGVQVEEGTGFLKMFATA